MKPVTPELEALLETSEFAQCELYTLTLFGGDVIRLTNAQVDVAWDGETYSSRGARVDKVGSRSTAHWKIGLDVDTWTFVVMPRLRDEITGEAYPDKINGTPWAAAARAGALASARVQVDRAYFQDAPTFPLPPTGAVPVGVLALFVGIVGEVDPTDTTVSINVLDYRSLLSLRLPRNLYRASCRHTLFSAGCGLTAATFKKTGVVGAGSTGARILSTIGAPAGSGTYALGRVVMTSGLNATFSRAVRSWTAGTFGLMMPFPYPLTAGDTFDAYPGCDKSTVNCTAFANILNFGGQPDIPDPATAI